MEIHDETKKNELMSGDLDRVAGGKKSYTFQAQCTCGYIGPIRNDGSSAILDMTGHTPCPSNGTCIVNPIYNDTGGGHSH